MIPRCKQPIFIAHGDADTIVPFEQGERLFAAVRGPKHVVKRGKTPVLSGDQVRQLIESIDERQQQRAGTEKRSAAGK
jgi:fermentation-respiration switch protein FrsA (DUF1100 family)